MLNKKKESFLEIDSKKILVEFRKRIKQKNLILKWQKNKIIVSGPACSSWENLSKFLNDNLNLIKEKTNFNESLFTEEHYKINKKEAENILNKQVKKISLAINLIPKKVIIRNQSSRWGSCSSGGTISLNYRLAFLPENLMNYVIIHELCHLRFMHHGKSFWLLVEKFCPDFKQDKKELRKNSKNIF